MRDESEIRESNRGAEEVRHEEPANALTWLGGMIVLQGLQVYLVLPCQLAMCSPPLQNPEISLRG